MSPVLVKLLRAVAAVVVLVVLLVVVQGWVSAYRNAPETSSQDSQLATGTAGASDGESDSGDGDDKSPAESGGTDDEGADSKSTSKPDEKAADSDNADATAKRVVVLVDGLNLRLEPVATGAVIRGLKADEKLVVLRKKGDWYYVRTASGTQGWISSNPSYVRSVKK